MRGMINIIMSRRTVLVMVVVVAATGVPVAAAIGSTGAAKQFTSPTSSNNS